jgi:hypothetical protein
MREAAGSREVVAVVMVMVMVTDTRQVYTLLLAPFSTPYGGGGGGM